MNTNRRWLRILLLLGLVAGIAFAIAYRDHFDAAVLEAWIHEAGIVAPLLFILIYAIAAVLFLPGTVLTLAGGALFGPVLGTFYNLTGATLGATLAFLIARYLAADWVTQKTGGRVKQLISGVEGEGWRFVAFVRLVPLFPFNLLNYALGVTRLRLAHYIIASYVFMLPGAAAYTYLGYAGREALAGGEGIIRKALLALALLAIVVFLPRLISRLRRGPMLEVEDLVSMRDSGDKLCILDVRTTDDFTGEQGHIPEARNIPLEVLQEHLDELVDYSEHPVAIVCRTDKRSMKAALLLSKGGFSDVHVVRGGMTRWHELGLPVTH
ncbi:MAG: VTT domain-containing protein [Gammaproteobacteria bacterium]|nr:VTT domain-containing protein [Gammaproteobacteria bacterium]